MCKRRKYTAALYMCVALCMAAVTACGSREKKSSDITEAYALQSGEQTAANQEKEQQKPWESDLSEEYCSTENVVTEDHSEEGTVETAASGETVASQKESPEITIKMVGDILLHDRVAQYAKQEDGIYCFDVIFDGLEEEIKEADLAIVNQEVIIAGEEYGVSGYPCFNAPFELGDALVDAGFDVICHGTNHALDKGKKGLLSCIDFWKTEYPEIAVLGIYETAEERNEIYIFEQDGIRVAVLNYTYGTNGIALPGDMPYAVNLLEENQVVADIEKAEEMADFTIVCPHWGTEYVLEETTEQRRWAQIFLEHGVDLVLGTHPHVIEPVEILQDEATGHEMLVYYSLGNFVNWTSSEGKGIANRMVGGMADVTIGFAETGEVVVKDYSVTAVVTHLESEINGVYTTRLSDYSQELSLENEIIAQDPAFSKEYCVDLCNQVWGELWQ